MESPWSPWVRGQLARIVADDHWRSLRTLESAGPRGVLTSSGQEVVNFASNDYLGLSQHPAVKAAAVAAVEEWGTGAGASRLVTGTRPGHVELEAELARWRGTEAALLFPTGYAANTGLLGLLGAPGVRICSDALNHASIVDGCRLAASRGAEVRVYRHLDLDDLARQLDGGGDPGAGGAGGGPGAAGGGAGPRTVIVTDTVFSMDGDVAPLAQLGQLAAARGALLVVDDAHAVLPVPEPGGTAGEVVRVGTLSKALGSLGGFVAGSRDLVDLLVNRARPFIFSTASPPPAVAAAWAALAVVRSPEGDLLKARLEELVGRVAPGHGTPVVPVVLGSAAAALAASDQLLRQGLLVPAIRPPTVPPGTSRLRIALSAAHTDAEVDALVAALADLPTPVPAPDRAG